MKIKKLSSILIFVLLISCLAGCGSKTQPKQEVSIPEDYKGLMSYLKGQAKSDELTCWYTSEEDKAWLEGVCAGGAQAGDALLHGKVDVRCAGEAAALSVGLVLHLAVRLHQGIDDALLMGEGEAATGAHIAQGESATPYLTTLVEALGILGIGIVLRGIAIEDVHEF